MENLLTTFYVIGAIETDKDSAPPDGLRWEDGYEDEFEVEADSLSDLKNKIEAIQREHDEKFRLKALEHGIDLENEDGHFWRSASPWYLAKSFIWADGEYIRTELE